MNSHDSNSTLLIENACLLTVDCRRLRCNVKKMPWAKIHWSHILNSTYINKQPIGSPYLPNTPLGNSSLATWLNSVPLNCNRFWQNLRGPICVGLKENGVICSNYQRATARARKINSQPPREAEIEPPNVYPFITSGIMAIWAGITPVPPVKMDVWYIRRLETVKV